MVTDMSGGRVVGGDGISPGEGRGHPGSIWHLPTGRPETMNAKYFRPRRSVIKRATMSIK